MCVTHSDFSTLFGLKSDKQSSIADPPFGIFYIPFIFARPAKPLEWEGFRWVPWNPPREWGCRLAGSPKIYI